MNRLIISMCIGIWIFTINQMFVFRLKDVEPSFEPYRTEFYDLLAEGCPSKVKYETNFYKMKFGQPAKPDDWIGICEPKMNGFTIEIDKAFWDSADEQDRRQLIYHELSHCVIFRDHVTIPTNYMYPTIMRLDPDKVRGQLQANIAAYCNE